MTTAILGAGSWGTALGHHLARLGHPVRIWAFEPEVVDQINRLHVNQVYLADSLLDERLVAGSDAAGIAAAADVIIMAPPSHAARRVLEQVREATPQGAILACATKGIETSTLKLMSDVGAEVVPHARFVVLSGPSFAAEVHAGQPTAVVAASTDDVAAARVQALFSSPTFRVYSSRDVVGTEIAGAMKNVIAIASGILTGLGLGNNPRAALVTRGLAEIARLGVALGADPRTFSGLAGMGDLMLTAYGQQSRNRSLGEALGQGATLREYQTGRRTVAEGVNTTRAALRLAEQYRVELPITEKVAEVLFDGKDPRTAITELMERTLKAEQA